MICKTLFLIAAVALLVTAIVARAQWDDCRFAETDCAGQCGQFTDTDGDGICDHSQPAPEDRETVEEATSDEASVQVQQGPLGPGGEQAQVFYKGYHLLELVLVLLISYVASFVLVKKKKMSIIMHRRIWNVALLISFVIVGVLGVLLVVRINYGVAVLQNFFMLYYHVEAGIAMATIAVFHLHNYRYFYTCMFRRGNKCES